MGQFKQAGRRQKRPDVIFKADLRSFKIYGGYFDWLNSSIEGAFSWSSIFREHIKVLK